MKKKEGLNKILIIEDEIVVAKSIAKILVNNGYKEPEIATGYKEAKQKLLTLIPDLILCDINLNSDNSGIDLMEEVSLSHNIPFIYVTANSETETIKKANNVAPCNYITKPFSEKQLLVSIENVFAQIEKLQNEIPTPRELAVLKLIAKGYGTKQIAELLSIAFNTVESHRKSLLRKYQVSSMAELICLATTKGWVKYGE